MTDKQKKWLEENAEFINKGDLKEAVSRIPFEISHDDSDFIVFLLGYTISPASFVRVIPSTFSRSCRMGLKMGNEICVFNSWYAKGDNSDFGSIYYTTSLIERGISLFL
jgi:hypothetical protein